MTEKQIEYILAIDQFRSISKAAESLHISQPYLSQYLSNLEDDLGYKLFDRSSFPIKITSYGEAYVEAAKEINNLQIDLKNKLREIDNEALGSLSIAAPSHINFSLMPKVLNKFCSKYPKYNISIKSVPVDSYSSSIKNGYVDLVISTRKLEDSSITSIETKPTTLVLAAPKEYDLDSGITDTDGIPFVDTDKLANVPYIEVVSETGFIKERAIKAIGYNKFFDNAVIKCDSYYLAVTLVEEGLGATIIPSTCVGSDNNAVKIYKVQDLLDSRTISIYFRKKSYISKATQDLINLIIDEIHKTI